MLEKYANYYKNNYSFTFLDTLNNQKSTAIQIPPLYYQTVWIKHEGT